MSNFDDDLINDAFGEFSASAAPKVKFAGTTTVRATVRHRRIVRATALSVLGALLVVVPTATYALTSHDNNSPPNLAAASPSVAVSADASPSSGASPSGSPLASPSSSSSAPVTKAGEITVAQLTAGKVVIPKWRNSELGCPTGSLRLAKPTSTDNINHSGPMGQDQLIKVVYTNLDSDPSLETAALITCQYGEAAMDMVIGFDRDASGKIVTLGEVAEGHIWSMTVRSSGGVTIDISDMQACCETPKPEEIHQTRGYAWTGSQFEQASGPTFTISHSKPITFNVVAASSWGPEHNGVRTGTLTVTITNKGSAKSNSLLVWNADGSTDAAALSSGMKLVNGLDPGQSVQVKLQVDMDVADASDNLANDRVSVYEMGSAMITADGNGDGGSANYSIWS